MERNSFSFDKEPSASGSNRSCPYLELSTHSVPPTTLVFSCSPTFSGSRCKPCALARFCTHHAPRNTVGWHSKKKNPPPLLKQRKRPQKQPPFSRPWSTQRRPFPNYQPTANRRFVRSFSPFRHRNCLPLFAFFTGAIEHIATASFAIILYFYFFGLHQFNHTLSFFKAILVLVLTGDRQTSSKRTNRLLIPTSQHLLSPQSSRPFQILHYQHLFPSRSSHPAFILGV